MLGEPQSLSPLHLASTARTCKGPTSARATPELGQWRWEGPLCARAAHAASHRRAHAHSASSWASPTAPEEAPESPEGPRLGVLAVTDRTPDSLRLSWTVAQGSFDSFVVQYRDTDGQSQALLVGGDQNKVLVSGLEPSTPYKFFLYGLHEGKRLGPVSAEGTTGTTRRGPAS